VRGCRACLPQCRHSTLNTRDNGSWTGTNDNTVWYGSNHEAAGYDQRTQEYALFHFNYEHEFKVRATRPQGVVVSAGEATQLRHVSARVRVRVRWCTTRACACAVLLKIPSNLAAKREWELSAEGREELRALVKAPRLTWRYSPFDFFAAPPCGTPGGGHCPLAPVPAHVADNNENPR
jgi:hypothetical protein